MGKYNEIGVDKFGNVDPVRKMVHEMVGLFGSQGGTGTREMADDLYKWMKGAGKPGGGKDDGKDDGKGDFGNEGPGTVVHGGGGKNYDVDFTMKGEMRRPPKWDSGYKPGDKDDKSSEAFKMGRGIIPKNPLKSAGVTTMKQGGLVRGAGCAQRGRGKGKMV